MTSGCDAGITLSCVTAKQKPVYSSSIMTVSVMQMMAHNMSTLTTEALSTSTSPAATESPATTAQTVKDIWTVSFPNTNVMCIVMTAHITVAYNDGGKVINVMILLLLEIFYRLKRSIFLLHKLC